MRVINLNLFTRLGGLRRGVATYSVTNLPEHRSLVVETLGDPVENVLLKQRNPSDVLPPELGPKQVLVEHLAACINPSDLSLIRGVYGIRPKLPAVIGLEGVTRVKNVGTGVAHLKPGDIALSISLVGYWQSYSVQDADSFYKVNEDLDVRVTAQLKVNPCTAYRMLKDFYPLQAGDTIIQNGANSAVGVYVVQLCKLWGIKTINVIRDGPKKDEIIQELKDYGADFVLTEAEVANMEVVSPILDQIGKPKLCLNCVGGKNADSCHRVLDYGGFSVTYGVMSGQPYRTPSGTALIFKKHTFTGFWMSDWYKMKERDEIGAMLGEIGQLFKQGVLKPKSSTLIDFEDRNVAFKGSNNTKYIFLINK